MDLDGSLRQVHLAGDLAVGSPGGEPGEDGPFPVGELTEQGIPVGLLAGIREQGDELVDEPPGRGGARTASPPATVRMAVSNSAGGASLRRNPLAPALSPAKTYSSRSKVVRIRTLLAGVAAVIAAVAWIPSMPGIRTSISTTSGCRADVMLTPVAPSAASPATSM